jgi:membrane-bound lytic murein transglycosylase F
MRWASWQQIIRRLGGTGFVIGPGRAFSWPCRRYRTPKTLLVSILALLSLLALPANSRGVEDFPTIRETGRLRVIYWSGAQRELFSPWPGFGFEREVLEGFASFHKLSIEAVLSPTLEGTIPLLQAGKGDLIAVFAYSESRGKLVDFTVGLFPLRYVVVTRRPHPPILTVEELRKERLGSVRGSTWVDQLTNAQVPAANIDASYTAIDDVIAALRAGKITATVVSVRVAMIERQKDPALELGLFLGKATNAGFAVRKDEPALLQALNDYLENVRRTATWSRLVVKYFGDDALEVLKKSRE